MIFLRHSFGSVLERAGIHSFPCTNKSFVLLLAYIVTPEIDGIEEARSCVAADPAIRIMFFMRFAIVVLRNRQTSLSDVEVLSDMFCQCNLVDGIGEALSV